MSVTLPTTGQANWDVPLNSALQNLDTRIVALETKLVTAPSLATSNGVTGHYSFDSSYLYICVATNTWKRIALSSW
jgi:hypothetical protein